MSTPVIITAVEKGTLNAIHPKEVEIEPDDQVDTIDIGPLNALAYVSGLGTYELEIEAEGYEDYEGSFSVIADGAPVFVMVEMQKDD